MATVRPSVSPPDLQSSRPMRFEEYLPGPAAAELVDRYWRFSVTAEGTEPIRHVIVPDGLVSLSLTRSADGERVMLAAPSDRAHVVSVLPGTVSIGVRFQAGRAPRLPGAAISELRNQMVPANALPEDWVRWCHAYLSDLRPDGVVRLDTAVRGQFGATEARAAMVTDAARHIIASDGQMRIAYIAAALGLSERQLRRRFLAGAGLTPKAFARVRRVRAACVLALADPVGWSRLAMEAGYADQAHLIREIARIFGQTPPGLMAYLRSIRHDFGPDAVMSEIFNTHGVDQAR